MKINFIKENKIKKSGFTLVELLVSVALFTMVMTVSIGSLLVLTNANRKEQALKTSVNNINFAIETMAREIRMGRFYYCDSVDPIDNSTRDCPSGEEWIGFKSSDDDFVEYKKVGTELRRRVNRASTVDPFVSMTSLNVEIDVLRFYVTGTTIGTIDGEQPLVTIVMAGSMESGPGSRTDFNIQSTVAQRFLDYDY